MGICRQRGAPVKGLRKLSRSNRSLLLILVLLAGCALSRPVAAQSGSSLREVRQRQKEERKALKLQQKALKQTLQGRQYSRLDRKRAKRQMKTERKLLRRAQRDEVQTAKQGLRFAKKNPDDVRF